MKKFFSFLCLLMIISNACAHRPIEYNIKISFRNACDYPVQIKVNKYFGRHFHFNKEESADMLIKEEDLKAGETTSVFDSFSSYKDVKTTLPDDYKLEINAEGKTISLDKKEFLRALKKSDFSREKCGFMCRTYSFSGTINDPSLCP